MTGQVIEGKFEILDEIGHGGMGVVYRARQLSLDRIVALKMLSASLVEDEEFRGRFRQEAKIIARLTHPNIIHVYDIYDFEGPNAGYCIVMEYLEGRPLRDVLREAGRLPVERALVIAEQVATGLAYAHNKGIVHRDIKPDNIMMLADDRVKLMDFGIARLRESSIQTQTGVSMGTPQFMSPEQAAGKPVDTRSDLYSLAIVLYNMVTGELPFAADNPLAVALKHIQEAPRRPSELNPAIPPALDAVILKGLAKRPSDRFQSGEEFREALVRVPAGGAAPPAGEGKDDTFISTPVASPLMAAGVESDAVLPTPKVVVATVAEAPRRKRFSWVWVAAALPGLIALGIVLIVVAERPEWLPGGYSPEVVARLPFERQLFILRTLQSRKPEEAERLFKAVEPALLEHWADLSERLQNQAQLDRRRKLRADIEQVIYPLLDPDNDEQRREWEAPSKGGREERLPGRKEATGSGGYSQPMLEKLFAKLDLKQEPNPKTAKAEFQKAQAAAQQWKATPTSPMIYSCSEKFVEAIRMDRGNWQYQYEFAKFLMESADQSPKNLRATLVRQAQKRVDEALALCTDLSKKAEIEQLKKQLAPASLTSTTAPLTSERVPVPTATPTPAK